MELFATDEGCICPDSQATQSVSEEQLHEKERLLEILDNQIKEKDALLKAKEEEMTVLEERIKEFLSEIEEREMALTAIEGKTRRLERQSRRYASMAY